MAPLKGLRSSTKAFSAAVSGRIRNEDEKLFSALPSRSSIAVVAKT